VVLAHYPTKFLRVCLFDLPSYTEDGHGWSIKLNKEKGWERKAEIRDAIRIIIIGEKG